MAILKNGSKFEDNKTIVKSINGNYADTNGNINVKSTKHNITLLANNWTGSQAPYNYAITIQGMDTEKNWEITNSVNPLMTQEEKDAFGQASIVCGTQTTNTINLIAYGEKPTIDIHILVIVRED